VRSSNPITSRRSPPAVPVFHICQDGFVAHRYSAARGHANPSVYCTALFDVITRVYFSLLNEESRSTA
jgi:hypothetical protein